MPGAKPLAHGGKQVHRSVVHVSADSGPRQLLHHLTSPQTAAGEVHERNKEMVGAHDILANRGKPHPRDRTEFPGVELRQPLSFPDALVAPAELVKVVTLRVVPVVLP